MPATVSNFTDAIHALLDRFGQALKLHGAAEHSVRAYLFGGCAVHLHASARVSSDLDMEVDAALLPRHALLAAKREAGYVLIQRNAEDAPGLLELDQTYNTTLGPLHMDFQDRARPLERVPGSPLLTCLPSREDLALTKLGRLSEADVQDILTLMGDPGASWDLLRQLTEDAQAYYAGPSDLLHKFDYLIKHRRHPPGRTP